MPKPLSLEAAQKLIRTVGAEPLFEKFLGTQHKHPFRCACGVEELVLFSTIGRSLKKDPSYTLKCVKCRSEGRPTYTAESVQALFRDLGAEPLFSSYSGLNSPLAYRCHCGRERTVTLESLTEARRKNPQHTIRCQHCAHKEYRAPGMLARVRAFFIAHNATPLFDSYQNNTQPLQFRCSCGRLSSTTWMSLQGNGCLPRCTECRLAARPRGSEHPSYNHALSLEEREQATNGRGNAMPVWSSFIRKLWAYKCAITKESWGDLPVHHLTSWSASPEQRFSIGNGVPLAEPLHREFHHTYDKWRGTATREQFEQFYLEKSGRPFEPIVNPQIEAEIIFASQPIPDLLAKKELLHSQGKRYLPFYETEIRTRSETVISMLAHRGEKTIQRFSARTLQLVQISSLDALEFLDNNHIQGSAPATIYLGLKHPDTEEILSVMSFMPSRFKAGDHPQDAIELVRFATKRHTHIPGAASRLLRKFITQYSPRFIVTYADRRFSNFNPAQTMYAKLGFTLSHASAPSYWYTLDGIKLENRMSFQKAKLKAKLPDYDPLLTERENMARAGYSRLPDCGTFVFIMDLRAVST